jgi:protein SCO1
LPCGQHRRRPTRREGTSVSRRSVLRRSSRLRLSTASGWPSRTSAARWSSVTFIYASYADTCPLLIAKLAGLQDRLGRDFGLRVFFVAITLDPERDTPEVLKRYAESHGARPEGWALLTGTPSEIRDIPRRYGVYYKRQERGDVDHTFLTSVVDRSGTLRVQYLGVRFDPNGLLKDIQSPALLFGVWDSTGLRRRTGAKFARLLVSEIVGFDAVAGRKTASRIDPLQIFAEAGRIYVRGGEGDPGWTTDREAAAQDEKGNPVLWGRGADRGRPSKIVHGNVTPSVGDPATPVA